MASISSSGKLNIINNILKVKTNKPKINKYKIGKLKKKKIIYFYFIIICSHFVNLVTTYRLRKIITEASIIRKSFLYCLNYNTKYILVIQNFITIKNSNYFLGCIFSSYLWKGSTPRFNTF